jgi:hypothetical protein
MRKPWVEALLGAFLLGVVIWGVIRWTRHKSLICEHAGEHPRCTVAERGPLTADSSTIYDDPVDVRSVMHDSNHGHEEYQIVVRVRGGRDEVVMEYVAEDDAKAVDHWFVNRAPRVEVVDGAFSIFGGIMLAVFSGCVVLLGWSIVLQLRDLRAPAGR